MDDEKVLSWTILSWVALIFLIMLLCGCSPKTPVSDINNDIQQGVNELVDYANNNMVIDSDKKLLIEGAKTCAAKANAMEKTCNESLRAYKAEASGWKLATTLMSIIAGLLGFLWFKK